MMQLSCLRTSKPSLVRIRQWQRVCMPPLRVSPGDSVSNCGSAEGAVTSTGCGKGTCGGGCSSSASGGQAAHAIQTFLDAAGVGTMSTMMTNSTVGISREDITTAFQTRPSVADPSQGERVISIAELLASCPPDLIWEEEEDMAQPGQGT